MFKILIQQKPDGMTTVERRTSQEFILLKASPSTGKVIAINSLFPYKPTRPSYISYRSTILNIYSFLF